MDFYYAEGDSKVNSTKKHKKDEEAENRSYRPLVINQIKKADSRGEDDSSHCYVDNTVTTFITTVGVVRSITRNDSCVNYTIEDGTGAIDVVEWTKAIACDKDMLSNESSVKLDRYVRVSGKIHFFNGKPQNINAFKVSAVTDHNETTYHLLDAIHVHLLAKKTDNLNTMSGVKGEKGTTSGIKREEGTMSGLERGEEKDQVEEALVKAAIRECSKNDAGANIYSLIAHLKDQLPETKVKVIIEKLKEKGEIYNTCDNDHIKSVDE